MAILVGVGQEHLLDARDRWDSWDRLAWIRWLGCTQGGCCGWGRCVVGIAGITGIVEARWLAGIVWDGKDRRDERVGWDRWDG